MSETMRERIARALYAQHSKRMAENEYPADLVDWATLLRPDKQLIWFPFADAVLAELREPTEAMVWAYELPHVGPDEIRDCWQAMIDAA